MPKIIRPLTDAEVRGAKAKERDFSLFDGGGLLLYVKTTGSKIWRLRYYQPYTRKRHTLTIGSYPEIRLQEARQKREEARLMLARGIDPNAVKRESAREAKEALSNTIRQVAFDWLELKREQGISPGTYRRLAMTVKNHIVEKFGRIPVSQITPRMVINSLQPVKAAGHLVQVAHIAQVLNRVMSFAVNTGLIDANPLTKISAAFPSPGKSNLPAIKSDELPDLLAEMRGVEADPIIHASLDWLMLTMTRPSEAIEARWDEINLEDRVWVIPAERMKMRREHIVPLSEQAIKVLSTIKIYSGGEGFLFPSPLNVRKPIARGTINKIFYKTKFKGRMVPHGFRSLASTTLNECGFNPDVIEAALAHGSGNRIRDIYNRTTYIEQRRVVMDWWGKYIDSARDGVTLQVDGYCGLQLVNNE